MCIELICHFQNFVNIGKGVKTFISWQIPSSEDFIIDLAFPQNVKNQWTKIISFPPKPLSPTTFFPFTFAPTELIFKRKRVIAFKNVILPIPIFPIPRFPNSQLTFNKKYIVAFNFWLPRGIWILAFFKYF